MTKVSKIDEPSADEIAAAEAVLARRAAVGVAKVRALAELAGFSEVLAAATDAREKVGDGAPFHACLNAIVVGMTGLQTDLASTAAPASALLPATA